MKRERRMPKNPISGSLLGQIGKLNEKETQGEISKHKEYQRNDVSKDNDLEKYKEVEIYSLSDASEKRNLEALKYFLIHIEDIYPETLLEEWFRTLYEAVKSQYTEIIDYLLENDRKGDYLFFKRYNYPHFSFSNLHYDYLYTDDSSYPCELHIASKMGYIDTVKKLVQHYKSCEEEYNRHNSSWRSFRSGHIEEEHYINLEDRDGNTALLYAIQNNHTHIIDYLIHKGSKLTVTIYEDKLEKYEHEDYNSEYCSSYSETRYYDAHYHYHVSLLFKVYKNISPSLLALLIENGLDINDNGYKGKTILDKAYEDNDNEAIKLLTKHGAVLSKEL